MSNRILDYPEATEITSNDYILLDNEGTGAKCIKASALNINMDNYTIKEARGAIASFDDGEDLPLAFLGAYITALQDLHGYDYPWVGGSGKNKLPMTVEGIKAVNTYHSWSGNSTTINNVTITIETDSVGNVTGIRFNGTASADITFNLATNISIPNGSYKWSNDQIVNISNLWMSLTSPNIAITLSTQKEVNVTVSNDSIGSAYIYASSGNVFNNIVFKPMIRLASVTDATFAPYSNICPISGWDEVNVTVADDLENPTVSNVYTIDLDGTRYGGKVDLVSGVLTVDRAYLDLGSRTYIKVNDGYFYAYITDISIINFNANEPTAECEIYKLCTSTQWYNRTIDSGIFGVENSHVIYVADTRFSDGNSLKTALADKKLVYTLATPLTYQLSKQQIKSLVGENNFFANTGDSVVDYRKRWVTPEM